jgi:hypothetical protein
VGELQELNRKMNSKFAMDTGDQVQETHEDQAEVNQLIQQLDSQSYIFNHQCQECPKKFRTKQELASHQDFHLGIKNFACKITGCDYSNESFANLKAHYKRHSDLNNGVNQKLLKFAEEDDKTKIQEEIEELIRDYNNKNEETSEIPGVEEKIILQELEERIKIEEEKSKIVKPKRKRNIQKKEKLDIRRVKNENPTEFAQIMIKVEEDLHETVIQEVPEIKMELDAESFE